MPPTLPQVLIGIASLFLAFEGSGEGKLRRAVGKLMEPYQAKVTVGEMLVDRSIVGTLRERVKELPSRRKATTVLAGLHLAGKTFALEQALVGLSGVITVAVESDTWQADLLRAVGVEAGMLEEVLSRTAEELRNRNAINKAPIIILDIPRKSTVNIDTVSTFCKKIATDNVVAHVIVVASSASFALGFDAGGGGRQYDMWIPDLTEKEARELMNLYGIDENDHKALMDNIGMNVGKLTEAAKRVKEVPIADLIAKNDNECEKEVANLLGIAVQDVDSKTRKVGMEIACLLLEPDSDKIKHPPSWRAVGISPEEVARRIKDRKAHGVFFHTTEQVWKFASPAHRAAAEKLLKHKP